MVLLLINLLIMILCFVILNSVKVFVMLLINFILFLIFQDWFCFGGSEFIWVVIDELGLKDLL